MSQQSNNCAIAVIGIDIGKNSFHVVGHDQRGAIVLRQKWSRGQVEARLANLSPCLIGMEACVGAHYLSRKLQLLGEMSRSLLNYAGRRCRDECYAALVTWATGLIVTRSW
jgi:transposase